jgi:molybdopterin-guanine dinucleotide biosynthesis protein A
VASKSLNRSLRAESAGLVFVGGRSSRLGVDKATLDIGGDRLVSRVIRALSIVDEVLVVGGDAGTFQEMAVGWCGDAYPGEGPLGALLSGFGCVDHDVVVACACDLANLTSSSLDMLLYERRRSGAAAAVPLISGRLQWHVAVWHRRALPVLEQAFQAGERSLHRAARTLDLVAVVLPYGDEFLDIDTPEDLRRLLPGELAQ